MVILKPWWQSEWWLGRENDFALPSGCGVIQESRLVNEWRELALKRDSVRDLFEFFSMKILELSQLAEKLDQFFHLVIWERKDGFEVVAILAEDFQDAFPLPMEGTSSSCRRLVCFLIRQQRQGCKLRICPMIFGRNSTR